MEKKLYFNLHSSDGFEGTMTLSGITTWIEEHQKRLGEENGESESYVIDSPCYLTDEEFDNLPEI